MIASADQSQHRTMAARYDRAAARYARWWAPVLEPTALALLDEVDMLLVEPPSRVLDVGTGTGVLAIDAVRRWPAVHVSAIDASTGMARAAETEADSRLAAADRARLELGVAMADRLPFGDGSFDLIVSSFVYQLVPNRARALREARRVLASGGRLAYVTWRDDKDDWPPLEAFDLAVEDAIIDEEAAADAEPCSGDLPSAEAAAAQLRAAGFRDVRAREVELEHRWTPESYLAFVEEYDEAELFRSLAPRDRRRLRDAATRRFAALRPEDFHWRTPVVVATGQRP